MFTGRAGLTRSIRSQSRRLTPSGDAVASGGDSVARETVPQRLPFGEQRGKRGLLANSEVTAAAAPTHTPQMCQFLKAAK